MQTALFVCRNNGAQNNTAQKYRLKKRIVSVKRTVETFYQFNKRPLRMLIVVHYARNNLFEQGDILADECEYTKRRSQTKTDAGNHRPTFQGKCVCKRILGLRGSAVQYPTEKYGK